MVRREDDRDDKDYRRQRSSGGGSEWLRWGLSLVIICLLIPSFVFVVKLSNDQKATDMKYEALRHDVVAGQERASEDRGELRRATDRLTDEIGKLRQDLQDERIQRVIGRPSDVHATFPRGKQFDK